MKTAFTRLERGRQRDCKGKAASPASFVELCTKAFVEAVTPQNILSGFKSYGISPFDLAYFLQHLPPARLKKPSPPPPVECPASTLSPAFFESSRSPDSPASGCSSPISRSSCTKSDAGVQCTSREINQATKDDPWNLRLGGFVTSETFIEGASQAKEPKQKPKAAPKRKLGHRITGNASAKAATEAAPKPARKRRRL